MVRAHSRRAQHAVGAMGWLRQVVDISASTSGAESTLRVLPLLCAKLLEAGEQGVLEVFLGRGASNRDWIVVRMGLIVSCTGHVGGYVLVLEAC